MIKLELILRFTFLVFARMLAYSIDGALQENKKKFKFNWILFAIKSVLLLISFYLIWITFRVKIYSIITYIEPIGWFVVSLMSNIVFWGIQINENNRDVYWETVLGDSLIDLLSFVLCWTPIFMQRNIFSWAGL